MRVPSPARFVGVLAIVVASVALAAPAHAAPPQAPGTYKGLGFDTCVAPDQATMDAWLRSSPFRAVGIYISGNSRYCGDAYQPNLSPSWVKTNANKGWRFIPIHVGYQSPCFKNNPRSRVQKKHMSKDPEKARAQGRSDAKETIAALRKFGFGPGSVSYLDIEWYDRTSTCDNATLEFTDAWTETLHAAGYRSGLYSSASAAIKAVDDALTNRRRGFNPPDHIWFAWTNGKADTDAGKYLRDEYYRHHQRIHQYDNGERETFGGKTLTIDWNAMDVSGSSAPAPSPAPRPVIKISSEVARQAQGSTPLIQGGSKGEAVARLQRALTATGRPVEANGYFGGATVRAVRSYKTNLGFRPNGVVTKGVWRWLQHGVLG